MSPHFKGDIKLLEKVQHRMTRLVPSLRKLDYEKRLEILNITTLQKRIERGHLIQVFKILNNFDQIELIREPTLRYESITRIGKYPPKVGFWVWVWVLYPKRN